ncbi:hypothetical protein [Rhizobium leguminosarum]|uniref:hypothetical protein n=1 Tax=Rhizobium leguminosarum TaxID=384 RepID=UPI001C942DC0|nr:hypothetical protein [Rhizobium leguminosarum]MBY5400772.1 hypothetical protein [Rhizobium leguminosarum]
MEDREQRSDKMAGTPDRHPGREPPIRESSEQQGMAPSVFDKDRVMPIGKPGVRVKDHKKR